MTRLTQDHSRDMTQNEEEHATFEKRSTMLSERIKAARAAHEAGLPLSTSIKPDKIQTGGDIAR